MEIKIEKSLLTVVAVITLVVVAMVVWVKRTEAPASRAVAPVVRAPQLEAQAVSQQSSTPSGATKENIGGEVTVSVTPVIAGDAELGFDVAINTHSVDMSAFDPKKQILLIGANGKETLPSNVAIEGSGHHQQLQLTFPKVEKPWKLVVRGVGGIPAREFSW
ncbi:MAG: hypothetical protein Q7S48_05195 [bacterium]|nr:hypothetical protein [bacterium]